MTPPGQWTIPSMSINHSMKHYKYVLGFSIPADAKVTTGIQRMIMVMAPTAQLGSLFVRLIGHHAKFTLLFSVTHLTRTKAGIIAATANNSFLEQQFGFPYHRGSVLNGLIF